MCEKSSIFLYGCCGPDFGSPRGILSVSGHLGGRNSRRRSTSQWTRRGLCATLLQLGHGQRLALHSGHDPVDVRRLDRTYFWWSRVCLQVPGNGSPSGIGGRAVDLPGIAPLDSLGILVYIPLTPISLQDLTQVIPIPCMTQYHYPCSEAQNDVIDLVCPSMTEMASMAQTSYNVRNHPGHPEGVRNANAGTRMNPPLP